MADTLLTADEYLATADSRPRSTQLVSGEVLVNSPRLRHQRLVGFLHYSLMRWTSEGPGRGESPPTVDVRIDDQNVVAPDVLWFAEGRLPPGDAAYVSVFPDLVGEVRSPATWRYDVGPKFALYERVGIGELWLVDTEANSVLVYRRSSSTSPTFDVALELSAGEDLSSPRLPGFALSIAELFNR